MKIREVILLAMIVGLVGVISILGTSHKRLRRDRTVLSESIQEVSQNFGELQRLHDLAIEFGFKPIIVDIVDHHSQALLREGGPEFRLIQTPEYLTHIFLSLIYAESKGNSGAVGDKGKARGLTQIWTSTARQYAKDITPQALLDPGTNIEISFLHFRKLLQDYRGNFTLVLLAWNRGPGRVNELIRWGQSPANGYGEKVFSASVTASRFAVVRTTFLGK